MVKKRITIFIESAINALAGAITCRTLLALTFILFSNTLVADESYTKVDNGFIEVRGGSKTGRITLQNAYYKRVNPLDLTSDIIIVYSNVANVASFTGSLKLGDNDNKIWANAHVLVVGGGGGGGFYGNTSTRSGGSGAGGGAGGLVEKKDLVFDSSDTINVVVGGGGAGSTVSKQAGASGNDSSLKFASISLNVVAKGGGGGAAQGVGIAGGSGGGGSRVGSTNKNGGAGTSGQGFSGGDAKAATRGAGGGGAGGRGADAVTRYGIDDSTVGGAPGGIGTNSFITGIEQWFAGGGGGSFFNPNNTSSSTSKYRGGDGGKGGGGNGGGVQSGTEAECLDGYWTGSAAAGEFIVLAPQPGVDGTGGGGGGGGCYANSASGATKDPDLNYGARGGSGIVIIRLSGFVVGTISLPEPQNYIYNGSERKAVEEFFAYSLGGDWKATDSGIYSFSATIADTAPYTWDDGSRGTKFFHWSIAPMPVEVPNPIEDHVFGDATRSQPEEKIAVNVETYGLDAEGYCYTNSLKYCQLTGYKATNAGEYTFTAKIYKTEKIVGAETVAVTNFIWASSRATDDLHIKWNIAQAENSISDLQLNDWQEGLKANVPHANWQWSVNSSDKIVYSYAKSDKRPLFDSDYNLTETPSEAGIYWVRAYIRKDSATEPGNWKDAVAYKRFCVWRHPSKVFADYVDITVDGNESGSTKLIDFPVLVRLSEAKRNLSGAVVGGVPGFHYASVFSPEEIRFVSISNIQESAVAPEDIDNPLCRDSILPYEIDTWNTKGDSLIWVKIPELSGKGTKFRMYWNRRKGAEVVADKYHTDTWDEGYLAVWHMNNMVNGALANSTEMGAIFNATGSVTFANAKAGRGVYVKDGDLIAPDFSPYLEENGRFAFSGFYFGNDYVSGNKVIAGQKAGNAYTQTDGWAFLITRTTLFYYCQSGNSTQSIGCQDVSQNWNHFAFYSPQNATGTKYGYCNGIPGTTKSGTIKPNGTPFRLGVKGFSVDELRLSKAERSAAWMKEEYNSINKKDYCVFSLVNQLQSDGVSRAWVNYWTSEPKVTEYVEKGKLEVSDISIGTLEEGAVKVEYIKMPENTSEGVDFTFINNNTGPYIIHCYMKDAELGTSAYPGPHTYLDGDRKLDLEIIVLREVPIDPDGTGGTSSGRVLLGNDDLNPSDPVTNQSYWVWEHLNGIVSSHTGLNLLAGTDHRLPVRDGSSSWHLLDVYFGNIMTNDNSGTLPAMSPALNSLTWSSTSKNTVSNESYAAELVPNEVAHLVMRNVGGLTDGDDGAQIISPAYTNGIGTIYFDAVNSCATNSAAFELVVETSTNLTDEVGEEWTRAEKIVQINVSGSAVSAPVTNDTVVLDAQGGGFGSFKRIVVPVNRSGVMRFRIRRISELYHPVDRTVEPDDLNGFIILDNIIVSPSLPDVRLLPYGWYDGKKTGDQVLGMETAFNDTYPTADTDNLVLRARLSEGADPTLITSARCFYRWRYLDSNFEPKEMFVDNEYKAIFNTMYLDPANGMQALEPIKLNGVPGDLEFYFKATAIIPYYKYVDYSGSGLSKPLGDHYTEHVPEGVVSRREGLKQASRGSDWFVRLREGASDFTSIRVYTEGTESEYVDMSLVANHMWRGFVRTREVKPDGIGYRFEAIIPKEPGLSRASYTTNYWKGSADSLTLPFSTVAVTGETNEWSRVPCDAATGYVMFQLDDRTKTITISHADYQNFNSWNDAWSNEGIYRGSSVELGRRTGVSSKMRRITEDFSSWIDTPATNRYWIEGFIGEVDNFATGFVPFEMQMTPNGWSAANAMWVGKFYHPYSSDRNSENYKLSGLALQLSGTEKGYVELINLAHPPRGIDQIKFKARVGQRIDFDSFAYADLGLANAMKEGTFITRVTFDENENKNFAGSPIASVIINYQPGVGCYEARLEQLNGKVNKGAFTNGNPDSHKLSLYRWATDEDENVVCTLLGAITNGANVKYKWNNAAGSALAEYSVNVSGNNASQMPSTKPTSRKFLPFLISTRTLDDGTTEITAGVWAQKQKIDATESESLYATKNWNLVHYRDTSPNHPTKGYYGLQSANSEVYFNQPGTYSKAVVLDDSTPNNANWRNYFSYSRDQFAAGGNLKLIFDGEYKSELENIRNGAWTTGKNRHRPFEESANEYGVKALSPSLKLDLYLGSAAGQAANEKFGTRVVSGFGTYKSDGVEQSFTVRSVANRSVKLAAAKSSLGDVVLTDISISQWGGDTYGDVSGDTTAFAGYNDGYGFRTNVVFTSGVIKDNKVLLSARRTKVGYPASIRTPLFDGEYSGYTKRGIGLGMFSFTYENAQENVNLLVQIATNSVGSDIRDLTASIKDTNMPGTWTTITNIDFSAMSALERRKGMFSHYFGLHGVKGVMRVVIDPKVVEAVKDETDESKFGEITISKFICRDEPDLDNSDWWGWNLRTLSYGGEYDAGMRTYLPDGDIDAGAAGMSLSLNNSTTDMVPEEDSLIMHEHLPFVQTPTFTSNIVGEISFRARKYDAEEESQNGEIQLYGASSGMEGKDELWVPIHRFVISNTTYRTYTYRTAGAYSAFRLGIVGVDGVTYHNGEERETNPACRVLIDEVMVFEEVSPTMGFRYVYPFRDGLDKLTVCTNVVDAEGYPLPDAQPIAGEDWTVQAEIEKRQLPDEIDLVTHKPEVIFYWYSGQKWGFSNWKNDAIAAGTFGKLTAAEGEDMIFRGSLAVSSDAIVHPEADDAPPKIVQYCAEVVFYNTSGEVRTNRLSSGEWKTPSWYKPVDYNEIFADWNSFAAFTIIDTISPGRVWINEANIFDGRSDNYVYFADTNQYIEVAVPELQSIENWRIEYIANNKTVHKLCTFSKTDKGDGFVTPTKDLSRVPTEKLSEYRTNDYVFLSVRSPNARKSGAWDNTPGAIDGTWAAFDAYNNTLDQTVPVALRLVRPSGVVEQEISLEGTNIYASGRYSAYYSATNWMENVKALTANKMYYVGNEMANKAGDSLGVIRSTGAISNDWSQLMAQTPGRVNEGQIVPQDYVIYANGSMMVVRARIGASGHIVHSFEGGEATAEELRTFLKKGGDGTNITYSVAKWWEIGSVTTNGVEHAAATGARGTFTVNIGAGQSNDVLVVATAEPYRELADRYGLTAANRYTPAVMDWLEKGKNYFEEPFANPGSITLAEYQDLRGEKVRDLSLTEMYWFDIDPTTNWILKAAVSAVGGPIVIDNPPPAVTNFRMKVHMEITNENTAVAYSPYILRGLEPGSVSEFGNVWTSATFKITGDLQGGPEGRLRWVPLRWFVFAPDITKPNRSASFDLNHEAEVDIWDPKDENNAKWTVGWSRYPDPIWYRWSIDDSNAPIEIETLMPDSKYSD